MRLIDADALLKALVRKEPFSDCARVVIAECMQEVRHAPTIEPDWTELMVICDNCGHAIRIKRTGAQPDNSCDGCRYEDADDGVLVLCGVCKRNHPDCYERRTDEGD